MKQLWSKFSASFLFTFLPLVSLLSILSSQTDVAFRTGALLAAAALWIIAMLWLDHTSSAAGPILVILLAVLVYIYVSGGILIFERVIRHWQETPGELWLASDGLAFLILMGISFVLLYLVRFFWTRLLVAAGSAAFWIWLAVTGRQVPRMAILCLVPLIVYVLIEACSRKSREREKNAPKILILTILFAMILAVVPVSSKPYPYKVLNKVWEGVEEIWKRLETQLLYRSKGGTEFTMDFNGAEDKKTVGEDKSDSSEHKMTVWMDYGDEYIIYLPGTTLDYYDGREWSHHLGKDQNAEVLNWTYDTAEHIYALWRRDQADDKEEVSDDVFRKRRLEIGFKKMDTRSLFTTPGLLRIALDEERFPYHAEAGRVQFDYTQKRDSLYNLFFLEDNTDNVERLIRQSEGYQYDENKRQSWGQITSDYSEQFLLRLVNTVQIEEALAAREELIQEHYLQLPDDFSEEIRSLALEITRDCETDYDKAQAIEAYLQENFTYTRDPKQPKASEDFLEHMMEVKEGYCTWFATASAILLRASGVPARYVQGYMTPLNGQSRKTLSDRHTHAWSEAYIQGYGWIIVESTPGYTTSYAAWEQIHKEEAEEEEELPEEETAEPTDTSASETSPVPGILLGGGIAIGLAAGLILLIRKERRKRRYQALNWTLRTREDIQEIFRLLSKKDYVRYPYESIRTFFDRVWWDDLGVDPQMAREARQVFEEAVFGEMALTEEDWQKSQKLIASLKKKKKRR